MMKKDSEDLRFQPWFRPNDTREITEMKLHNSAVGAFVVRNSSKPNHYALSYKTQGGKIFHSLIERLPNGYVTTGIQGAFPSLVTLLVAAGFLAEKPIPISGEYESRPLLTEPKKQTKSFRDRFSLLISKSAKIVFSESPTSVQMSKDDSQLLADEFTQSNMTSLPQNYIVHLFLNLSKGNMSRVTELNHSWLSLPESLATYNPETEDKVVQALMNPESKMHQKIENFVASFLVRCGNVTTTVLNVLLKEILNIYEVLQVKVTVTEGLEYSPTIWKTVDATVMPKICSQLMTVLNIRYETENRTKGLKLQSLVNISMKDCGVHVKYNITDLNPYEEAIDLLRTIKGFKTLHEKYQCIVKVCKSIVQTVNEFYARVGSSCGVFIDATELLPVLTYIVCKAQVPQLVSEVTILEGLIPDPMKGSLEGFALSAFSAAVNNLDNIVDRRERAEVNTNLQNS